MVICGAPFAITCAYSRQVRREGGEKDVTPNLLPFEAINARVLELSGRSTASIAQIMTAWRRLTKLVVAGGVPSAEARLELALAAQAAAADLEAFASGIREAALEIDKELQGMLPSVQ